LHEGDFLQQADGQSCMYRPAVTQL